MTRRGAASALLESAIDRLLRLDPEVRDGLTALAGRLIAVQVEGLGWRFYLEPGGDGIAVLDEHELAAREPPPEPDVTITGPPVSLLALAGRLAEGERLGGDVTITGDVALAQELSALLSRLEIDWEEGLARVLGDAPAHELGRGLRALRQWGRRARDTFLEDLGEYLEHEVDIVAGPERLRELAGAVDELRDDVERLEARIARIEQGRGR